MPAIRQSTSISEARDAASTAPISTPSSTPKGSAPEPSPKAAAPIAATAAAPAQAAEPTVTVAPLRIRNRLPIPEGKLSLDLGEPEEDDEHPAAKYDVKIHFQSTGGEDEEIGYIVARTLETEKYNSGFQMMCDDLSGELHGMASLLYDDKGRLKSPYKKWRGDLLYVEEILIKPRYRGYGIGLWAISQLMDDIPAEADLVVIISPTPLNPYMFRHASPITNSSDPYGNEDISHEQHLRGGKALGKYLARLGFVRMTKAAAEKRTVQALQYWGLCTAYEQPDVEEVVPHLF